MEYENVDPTVMWRESDYRCELWSAEKGIELRVYVSDVLTYREAVRFGTGGLRQAAALLANAQAAIRANDSRRWLQEEVPYSNRSTQ
jgi:hypothetical protein